MYRDLKNGLSNDSEMIIKLITYYNDTKPVGSFKYTAHKYPGDIDIFEIVQECCNYKELATNFIHFLESIIYTIKNKQDEMSPIYWGEFKAGLDITFKPTENDYIETYIYRNSKYLNIKDISDIYNSSDWKEFVKKFYIVRWSEEDIVNGYKKLKSGKKMSLIDALRFDTIIKLDLWATVNNNYTEITNFFILKWDDGNNINIVNPSTIGDREESLMKDIKEYSSDKKWKPLKLAKRLWILYKLKNETSKYKKIEPLFSTGIASLSQIEGEIEVLHFIIDKYSSNSINIQLFINQISRFKRRINDIDDINFSKENWCNKSTNCSKKILYSKCDNIVTLLKNRDRDDKLIIKKLKELEEIIHNIITIYSTIWIKKIGIEKGSYKYNYINNYIILFIFSIFIILTILIIYKLYYKL